MSKVVIGICAFVMLVITPSVHADPLVITSGSLSVSNTVRASYTLSGLNFSFTGSNGDSGNSPAANCHPCGGSSNPVNLSSFFVGTSLGSGSATINGMTFNNIEFLGSFNLSAPTVLLTGTSDISITVPFLFGGQITGCGDDSQFCSNELFTTQLTGQGLVTAEFTFRGTLQDGTNFYEIKSLTYNFTSSEVPEPMTLTLLAAGLIGLGAKLKSRKHRATQL